MSDHVITVSHPERGGTRVDCSCGWCDYWRVQDGSAQYSAGMHKAQFDESKCCADPEPLPRVMSPAPAAARTAQWVCPDHDCSCHTCAPCTACVECETCADHYGGEA